MVPSHQTKVRNCNSLLHIVQHSPNDEKYIRAYLYFNWLVRVSLCLFGREILKPSGTRKRFCYENSFLHTKEKLPCHKMLLPNLMPLIYIYVLPFMYTYVLSYFIFLLNPLFFFFLWWVFIFRPIRRMLSVTDPVRT